MGVNFPILNENIALLKSRITIQAQLSTKSLEQLNSLEDSPD